jgi:hypothetical protein
MVSGVESLVAEKLLLCYAPLIGEVAFDDLVPDQLCGRIWCVWFVRVVGPEPFRDDLACFPLPSEGLYNIEVSKEAEVLDCNGL